jgi:hypothetical protein
MVFLSANTNGSSDFPSGRLELRKSFRFSHASLRLVRWDYDLDPRDGDELTSAIADSSAINISRT